MRAGLVAAKLPAATLPAAITTTMTMMMIAAVPDVVLRHPGAVLPSQLVAPLHHVVEHHVVEHLRVDHPLVVLLAVHLLQVLVLLPKQPMLLQHLRQLRKRLPSLKKKNSNLQLITIQC